ncbi:uncharacterized protein LAESUDRAFT_747230 [Laetiporus sulphureus 93-53]|uniref:Uncharacterized protein n=1 Tax=Laetiporus sulphureus 93-53 TaxID=1314785 RepID=A0A165HD38_9APHY|nr:uncharacterized protein LAESUDRAFT_747230 [Laetiporus sulphureus 93-53]KZT11574.1 hypothetical protein LAESUDRAFT_747230 [Laetiporus sulphureus 93-53]
MATARIKGKSGQRKPPPVRDGNGVGNVPMKGDISPPDPSKMRQDRVRAQPIVNKGSSILQTPRISERRELARGGAHHRGIFASPCKLGTFRRPSSLSCKVAPRPSAAEQRTGHTTVLHLRFDLPSLQEGLPHMCSAPRLTAAGSGRARGPRQLPRGDHGDLRMRPRPPRGTGDGAKRLQGLPVMPAARTNNQGIVLVRELSTE